MQKGLVGADFYLELWRWSGDAERLGSAEDVAARVVAEIEAEWKAVRLREDRPG